jgi:hypothetical protein
MDCKTALEHLDCVRPDSDDLDLPEMADARAHLQSCDSCQQKFAAIQKFDLAVVDVVQSLDVPERLRSSLLDLSINPVGAVTDRPVADADSNEAADAPSFSRRRTIRFAVSAACAVMLAATAWLWPSQPAQFTEADLLQRLPLDLSSTEQFDTGFEIVLPATWSANRRLRVDREFRGIDLDDDAGHDAAVAMFSYSPDHNAPVNGILVAIPLSRVEPLPNAVSFARAESQYIRKDGRRLVAAVWQERGTVYVCMVLGSAVDLERIQRNLSTSAA